MKNLSEYTDEELNEEIQRRKEYVESRKIKSPLPVSEMDWAPVIEAITDSVVQLQKYGTDDEDTEHFIYERTMEAVYGKDVWIWYNVLLD